MDSPNVLLFVGGCTTKRELLGTEDSDNNSGLASETGEASEFCLALRRLRDGLSQPKHPFKWVGMLRVEVDALDST